GEDGNDLITGGNEPYGNDAATVAGWAPDSSGASQRLRSAGFARTLVVDAPNWGQDWSHPMRDNAAGVYASDPTGNTVFSIHMYGVDADRKSTRLNSSHVKISYAVFCLKKKSRMVTARSTR